MNVGNRMPFKPLVAAAIIGAVATAGCAGNGTLPAGKIATAERAINDAKAGTATVDSPLELKTAEEELAAAKAAMADKDYDKAARLADKASADADYARARAISAKSRKTADELRESVKSLQQEIERMPVK